MGWLMVGPESARYLADLGADVVKVESSVRLDPLRTLGPYKGGRSGINRSLSYHAINAGKRSIVLDAKHPRGHEVLLTLVRWADVFVESFAPGVIDSLHLSYEELRPENPVAHHGVDFAPWPKRPGIKGHERHGDGWFRVRRSDKSARLAGPPAGRSLRPVD